MQPFSSAALVDRLSLARSVALELLPSLRRAAWTGPCPGTGQRHRLARHLYNFKAEAELLELPFS